MLYVDRLSRGALPHDFHDCYALTSFCASSSLFFFPGNIIEELTSPNLAVFSFIRNTQHMPSWEYGCACLAVRCLVSISVDDAALSNAALSSSLCAVSLD